MISFQFYLFNTYSKNQTINHIITFKLINIRTFAEFELLSGDIKVNETLELNLFALKRKNSVKTILLFCLTVV